MAGCPDGRSAVVAGGRRRRGSRRRHVAVHNVAVRPGGELDDRLTFFPVTATEDLFRFQVSTVDLGGRALEFGTPMAFHSKWPHEIKTDVRQDIKHCQRLSVVVSSRHCGCEGEPQLPWPDHGVRAQERGLVPERTVCMGTRGSPEGADTLAGCCSK